MIVIFVIPGQGPPRKYLINIYKTNLLCVYWPQKKKITNRRQKYDFYATHRWILTIIIIPQGGLSVKSYSYVVLSELFFYTNCSIFKKT
jgi:hypothetical protein